LRISLALTDGLTSHDTLKEGDNDYFRNVGMDGGLRDR